MDMDEGKKAFEPPRPQGSVPHGGTEDTEKAKDNALHPPSSYLRKQVPDAAEVVVETVYQGPDQVERYLFDKPAQ